jgi:glycine hydroxymethyltransferase
VTALDRGLDGDPSRRPPPGAYQQAIVRNAAALADALTERGLRLVSGGTENHLMLIDLREGELTGRNAQRALDKARITTNCNAVPFDKRPPSITSRLRLGTPAVTTRGMREREMERVAAFLTRGLRSSERSGARSPSSAEAFRSTRNVATLAEPARRQPRRLPAS